MHAGEVKRRTNRKTKTEVVLIDNRQKYHESHDERWLVVCEDHDTWAGFRLRKHANRSLAKPDQWCGTCERFLRPAEPPEPEEGTVLRAQDLTKGQAFRLSGGGPVHKAQEIQEWEQDPRFLRVTRGQDKDPIWLPKTRKLYPPTGS